MRKNKRKKEEHHVDESWLLPYSDLLTLLVALFIVLFAMSEIDVQKYEEMSAFFKSEFSSGNQGIMEHPNPVTEVETQEKEEKEEQEKEDKEKPDEGQKELMNLQELQKKINGYIMENKLTESLETGLSDEGLMVSIKSDISFNSGSAEVNQGGREIAREISNLLITDPPHHIIISGHTDDVPQNNTAFGSNWELSVMRAVNFMSLVLDNDELDAAKFSAKGYGEHHPIAPNDSRENRAKNRRVEVLILPNFDIGQHVE